MNVNVQNHPPFGTEWTSVGPNETNSQRYFDLEQHKRESLGYRLAKFDAEAQFNDERVLSNRDREAQLAAQLEMEAEYPSHGSCDTPALSVLPEKKRGFFGSIGHAFSKLTAGEHLSHYEKLLIVTILFLSLYGYMLASK